ncbi:MAG: hypothetical protein EOO75_19195, partial [Myxococcales bacterium]
MPLRDVPAHPARRAPGRRAAGGQGRAVSGSRRAFLQASLAASGALVIAVALDGCGGAGAGARVARPDGSFAPSAWLRVHPDGRIVFVLDRVEMGQGTMTGLAQLVAEELGVEPAQLTVELAGADR